MTRSDLQTITRKQLAEMARDRRIPGWHAMRKDELVDALHRASRRRTAKRRRARPHNADNGRVPMTNRCRLSATAHVDGEKRARDLLRAEARGPHWLAARWTLTPRSLSRAEAALGVEWRQAIPVLRVFDVTEREGTATAQTLIEDVEIRQPLDHWYVCVPRAGRTYRMQLGYRAPSGNFFVLVESARVHAPREARPPAIGRAAAEPLTTVRNAGAFVPRVSSKTAEAEFEFRIDAEVILYGRTHPRADLTLLDRPLQPQDDGTFTVRVPLEEGRQVIPAACITPCGAERRTIVLAIERNTKHLEPQSLNELE